MANIYLLIYSFEFHGKTAYIKCERTSNIDKMIRKTMKCIDLAKSQNDHLLKFSFHFILISSKKLEFTINKIIEVNHLFKEKAHFYT